MKLDENVWKLNPVGGLPTTVPSVTPTASVRPPTATPTASVRPPTATPTQSPASLSCSTDSHCKACGADCFNLAYEGVCEDEQLPAGFICGCVGNLCQIKKEAAPCLVCSSGLAKTEGNANCDDRVDMIDFSIWRMEFIRFSELSEAERKAEEWTADFDCDGAVRVTDFSIWRMTMTTL